MTCAWLWLIWVDAWGPQQCVSWVLCQEHVACPSAQPRAGRQRHRHPCPWPQICVPVETSSPLVTSNQKEVLRCFTVLGEWLPGLGLGLGLVAASAWVHLCLGLGGAARASVPSVPPAGRFGGVGSKEQGQILTVCAFPCSMLLARTPAGLPAAQAGHQQ